MLVSCGPSGPGMSMQRAISGLAVSARKSARAALLSAVLCGLLSAGALAAPPPVSGRPEAAASSERTTQPAEKEAPASRPAPTSAPASGFLSQGKPRPLVTKPEGSTAGMTWVLLASLLVVLVLGALVFLVVKRLLPKLGVKVGRRIRVVETSYLGPRKAVHLLQVGSQRFLIGSTRERITMLSEVTLAFLDEGDRGAEERDAREA